MLKEVFGRKYDGSSFTRIVNITHLKKTHFQDRICMTTPGAEETNKVHLGITNCYFSKYWPSISWLGKG